MLIRTSQWTTDRSMTTENYSWKCDSLSWFIPDLRENNISCEIYGKNRSQKPIYMSFACYLHDVCKEVSQHECPWNHHIQWMRNKCEKSVAIRDITYLGPDTFLVVEITFLYWLWVDFCFHFLFVTIIIKV